MTLLLEIELISGRYEAAGAGDRDTAEWPPHPARVFCALAAGARTDEDWAALRWLESQPPPIVQAAPMLHPQARQSYVVTNTTDKDGGSQFHLARTNALKVRHAVIPTSARIRLLWADADADSGTVNTLDRLARRVPYLGRSTGVAALSVTVDTSVGEVEGLDEYRPAPATNGEALRVPYPGYLDLLCEQYERGQPPWEVSRDVTYARTGPQRPPTESRLGTASSVFTDVIVLRFTGVRPAGRLTARFTEALRSAVMSATADPLPGALHGHGADGRPHVAFLGLPDVEHPHADGHLMGMAVAIPDLPSDQRRAIVRGVLSGMPTVTEADRIGRRVLQLNVPNIGRVDLEYQPGLIRPWGLRPERWRQGCDRWVSVTPVVMDRYPHKGDFKGEIVRSCRQLGFPELTDVTVSTAPLVAGGIRMRPGDLPDQVRKKLFRHVELHFDRKVSGPVLLGAGRYLGIGLMVPRLAATGEREQS